LRARRITACIKAGADAPGWSAFDAALVRGDDRLRGNASIDDAVWDVLKTRDDEKQLMEPFVDPEAKICGVIGERIHLIVILNRSSRLAADSSEKENAMPTLSTKFTRALNLRYPIVSAPMAFAGGGALSAAVTRAGGLGLIGGGYGDPAWLADQFNAAESQRVGVGFITWSLRKSASLLTDVLQYRPAAVMLSFGDPRPFVDEIRKCGAVMICQCQNMEHVEDAVDVGADVVVAQGAEAGGHGALRGTLTFVPEVADFLQTHAPETSLLAAGGIADGRGLAAALMLGADGVLVGTRLWASREALVKEGHHSAIIETNGDGTVRTRVADIARQLPWPRGFTARIRRNAFTDRWHGREDALESSIAVEGPRYRQALAAGDPENTGVWFGEAAGIIHAIEPAAVIVERMAAEAIAQIERCGGALRA